MKPLGGKAYGHIPHLSKSRLGPGDHTCHIGQENILTKKTRDYRDLVIVTEKLDGSNCSVAKIDGVLYSLTRAGYNASSSPYKQHHVFNEWVKGNLKRFDRLLSDGERACGEWLYQAHGTRYQLPHEPFVIFDIIQGKKRVSYIELIKRAAKYDFITPRLIHIGAPITVSRVLKVLEPSGHGAIDPVEGAVWRVERSGVFDFIAKYVRPGKVDGKYMDNILVNIWGLRGEY